MGRVRPVKHRDLMRVLAELRGIRLIGVRGRHAHYVDNRGNKTTILIDRELGPPHIKQILGDLELDWGDVEKLL